MDYFTSIIPLAAVALNAVAQAAFSRAGSGLMRSIKTGFVFGLAAMAMLHERFPAPADILAANTLIYAALSYCYFHFLNLGETARRIRLLRELAERPGGMTEAELLSSYGSRDIVEARLGRLLRNGQVSRGKDGRLRIAGNHLLVPARMLRKLKVIFLGRASADTP